jgi:Protein of unknown function (DUF1344)
VIVFKHARTLASDARINARKPASFISINSVIENGPVTAIIRRSAIATAAFVLCSGFTLISDDVSGVVRSIDRSTRQILLEDGKSYTIARGIDLAKFAADERVTLHSENQKGKEIVTKLRKGNVDLSIPKARRNARASR